MLDVEFGQGYSKEKFADFLIYQKKTSLWSIAPTCLLLGLCPLFFICLLDFLPLDDIDKGLTGKNWVHLVTLGLGASYCSAMFYFRFQYLIPNTSLRLTYHVIAGSMLPLSVCLTCVVIETTMIFPIPFAAVVSSSVGLPCMLFTYAWFIRLDLLKLKAQVIDLLTTMGISFTILALHEAIGVFYTSVDGNQWAQSAVAMILPVLKFVFRSFYGSYFKDKAEGYATGLMTFEVELFNTLYTSIFMQSATNPIVMMSLISVDVFENVSFLYRMNKLGNELSKINTRGTTKHTFLRRVLFRTELVVLVEFIEVLTPLIYGIHLVLLRHAPNLQYFPAFASLSDAEFYESMENLVVLASFEFVSLVSLIITLKYRYDLPLLHQIGFFVDKHRGLIFTTTCMWLAIALATPCLHVGNDYSFNFAKPNFKIIYDFE